MIAASVDGFRSANDVIAISEADQEDLRFPFARTQELRVRRFLSWAIKSAVVSRVPGRSPAK